MCSKHKENKLLNVWVRIQVAEYMMAKKWQQRNGNSYLSSSFPNLGRFFFPSSIYEKQSTRTRLRVEVMVREYISYFKCLLFQKEINCILAYWRNYLMVRPNLSLLRKLDKGWSSRGLGESKFIYLQGEQRKLIELPSLVTISEDFLEHTIKSSSHSTLKITLRFLELQYVFSNLAIVTLSQFLIG